MSIAGSVMACRASCDCGKGTRVDQQSYVAYAPNASQIPPSVNAVSIPVLGTGMIILVTAK